MNGPLCSEAQGIMALSSIVCMLLICVLYERCKTTEPLLGSLIENTKIYCLLLTTVEVVLRPHRSAVLAGFRLACTNLAAIRVIGERKNTLVVEGISCYKLPTNMTTPS